MSESSVNGDPSSGSRMPAGKTLPPFPAFARRLLKAARRRLGGSPAIRRGRIRFGDLRRVTPISDWFGFDRGTPLDRVYIEEFLAHHSGDIRGRALEVGDNSYTLRFGGTAVQHSDVLHVDRTNPYATIIGDLADGTNLPSDTFDCIVLTQTLHLIYDMPRAVATLHRMLVPGGVLLVTAPGVSSIDRGEWGTTWHWSLTPLSLERLLADSFGARQVTVEAHGNVLVAAGFLFGLAAQELTRDELAARDLRYPVIIAARAVKAVGTKP